MMNEKWLADPDKVRDATALADVLTKSGPASHRLLREPLPSERRDDIKSYPSGLSDYSLKPCPVSDFFPFAITASGLMMKMPVNLCSGHYERTAVSG